MDLQHYWTKQTITGHPNLRDIWVQNCTQYGSLLALMSLEHFPCVPLCTLHVNRIGCILHNIIVIYNFCYNCYTQQTSFESGCNRVQVYIVSKYAWVERKPKRKSALRGSDFEGNKIFLYHHDQTHVPGIRGCTLVQFGYQYRICSDISLLYSDFSQHMETHK